MITKRSYFLISLVVSIFVHAGLLYLLPSFKIEILFKPEKIVDVELIKTSKVNTEKSENNVKNTKGFSASDLVSNLLDENSDNPKISKPEVKLPEFDSKEKINLDRKDENIIMPAYTPESVNIDVSSELKNMMELSSADSEAEADESNRELFKIESSSVRVRKPIFVPSMPDYSLQNDTEVKIQFYVDFNGNPLKITFLTATDSYIEKLSTDFVSKLKFEPADSNEQLDKAVITLFFRVK